jgi:hypothetical protein
MKCSQCNKGVYEVGYDIYPDDTEGVIEEIQYFCEDCQKISVEQFGLNSGRLRMEVKP